MTDFRAKGTIMGPAGLTAVFGMGTGVDPAGMVAGKRPAGGQARRPRQSGGRSRRSDRRSRGHAMARDLSGDAWSPSRTGIVAV